jgi:IS66 C-terminal element
MRSAALLWEDAIGYSPAVISAASAPPPFYSILQTAKLNDVNPEAYLTDTLAKIADGHPINRIAELMPWAYKPAAAQAVA